MTFTLIQQSGGTLSCTSQSLSNSYNCVVYATGGTATFTSCTITGNGKNPAVDVEGGSLTFENSNIYGGSEIGILMGSGSVTISAPDGRDHECSSTGESAVYMTGGSLTIKNHIILTTSSSYEAVCMTGGNYIDNCDAYIENTNTSGGIGFYCSGGNFSLYGYYETYGNSVYVTGGYGTIYGDACITRFSAAKNSYASCYIGGGTVTIYKAEIRNPSDGHALSVGGSASVQLGFAYSDANNGTQNGGYTPEIKVTAEGYCPIYANFTSSSGVLYVLQADITGADYGIYIKNGKVSVQRCWITLTVKNGAGIYIASDATSLLNVSIDVCYFYYDGSGNIYTVYNAASSYKSSISYNTLYYNGSKNTSRTSGL